MDDSYVCSGATMRCTMGTSTAKLTVLPSRTVYLAGQPMANINDHVSFVNLGPFGRCRSMGFPATASATAAHHGHLTPMPCMHNTPFPWMNGKNDFIIKDGPALLKSCTCSCLWGGTISLIDNGQFGEGTKFVQKKEKETFCKEESERNRDDDYGQAAISTMPPSSVDLVAKANKGLIVSASRPGSINTKEFQKKQRLLELAHNSKGAPMSEERAYTYANPYYSTSKDHQVNCPVATAAFFMRLMGYNVTAKGKNANEHTKKAGTGLNPFTMWKNANPSKIKKSLAQSMKNNPSRTKEEVYEAWFKQIGTKEDGYYTLSLTWDNGESKEKLGHVTVLKRVTDKNGIVTLTNIDPQSGKVSDIKDLVKRMAPPDKMFEDDAIMRMNDISFNKDYLDLFEYHPRLQ